MTLVLDLPRCRGWSRRLRCNPRLWQGRLGGFVV